jgi:hypothetical protein
MALPYDPRPVEKPVDFAPARNAPQARLAVHTEGDTVARYGDRAGEHTRMERGRFSAWAYVGIAFLLEAAVAGWIARGIWRTAGAYRVAPQLFWLGALAGAALALFTFRDRWRVIEAFSSRFCSGLANLSVIYVPLVALVYANVRGNRKLKGQ